MKISPETRERVLEAAWKLLAEQGRLDVGVGEIAAAAGVSRQTLHLAFGGRTGLLVAMARRADRISQWSERMRQAIAADDDGVVSLRAFTQAWLLHIPEIYPIAVLLLAARETDEAARATWNDRMESLHGGFATILDRAAAADRLRKGLGVTAAADLAWSLTHLETWRQLVVDRGWTPSRFAKTQIRMLEREIFGSEPILVGKQR